MVVVKAVTGAVELIDPSPVSSCWGLTGLEANLMSPINDVIVQQLLLIVLGGGHLLVPQPSVLTDFLQGVVLQQAAILKHSHQEILTQRTK